MKKHFSFLLIVCLVISCAKDEENECRSQVTLDETPYELNYGNFPPPQIDPSIELTQAKVQLGRMLFYEPRLSVENNQSCASCHGQNTSFSDTEQFSTGSLGETGSRQAMAIVNLAWNTNGFFWDGRSPTLAHQSLQPIVDPLEMAETHENVIAKLEQDQIYIDLFIRAYGDETISALRMGEAMEQFMITLISNDSKYDKYLNGQVQLTESEERGRLLYFTEYNPFFPEDSGADCEHCHGGFNFENDLFMNNGLDTDEEFTDLGFYEVTQEDSDKAKFKVTTLRNIELTPPYMHDGRFQTLEEVIDHYNDGIQISSTLDQALLATTDSGLLLSDQDKEDLINFLKTFTDETFITNSEFSNPF